MRRHLRYLMAVLGSIIIFCGTAEADTGDIALGGKAGSLGLGAEMTIGLLPRLNARVGLNWFTYSYDKTFDEIDYDLDLNLFSAALLADWHILGSAFRISGGLLLNKNELDLKARTDDKYFIIDDVAFPVEDVGDLKGTIDFNAISPYLGIGWGNAVGEDKRLSIFIDLGVLFQGSPQVEMSATGPIASDPDFQHHLNNEEKEMEDETDKFTIYPVIAIGIAYKF